jgi:uncharacterized protein (TIGR02118 family)
MISVNNMYPNQDGGRFDMDYYLAVHIPMAKRLMGAALKDVTVERGLNGGPPDSKPSYVVTARMLFDSAEAFYVAFVPHINTLRDDIPKYTNIQPVIQISEVIS